MNEIVKHEQDLFKKYSQYATSDREVTDSTLLSEDEKDLISVALNKTFVNPKFKMKHFVTSGQITPYSTIRQYFLELRAIEEQIENFERTLKKHELESELCDLIIKNENDPIKKKQAEIEKLEKDFHYRSNKRRCQQIYIEREQYLELIREFNELPEAKLPDGRLLMDILGTSEEDAFEREYWIYRLARMAAMDISSYGRISAGNLDAIHQMPQDMAIQALALAHELNLRNDNLSLLIKNEVEKKLIQNDPNFELQNKSGVTLVEHGNKNDNDNDDKGLLDVYNN